MVFNVFMDDKQIILSHGGPTAVAELLGLDKTKGGVQRVQNWMKRGIPAKVKIARPDLFLQHLFDGASSRPTGKERRKTSRRSTDKGE